MLLIARLDRRARRVAFVASPMESGVRFTAVDMPEADNLTIHVMAAVAEREAALISQRTRAALAARKARGLPLGRAGNLTHAARVAGAAATRAAALQAMRPAAAYAGSLRGQGRSLRQIAVALEEGGVTTRAGGAWSAEQVRRLLGRTQVPPAS